MELKGEGGKLRREQQDMRRIAYHLGHVIHVVRSFKRFVELVGKEKGPGEGAQVG